MCAVISTNLCLDCWIDLTLWDSHRHCVARLDWRHHGEGEHGVWHAHVSVNACRARNGSCSLVSCVLCPYSLQQQRSSVAAWVIWLRHSRAAASVLLPQRVLRHICVCTPPPPDLFIFSSSWCMYDAMPVKYFENDERAVKIILVAA